MYRTYKGRDKQFEVIVFNVKINRHCKYVSILFAYFDIKTKL